MSVPETHKSFPWNPDHDGLPTYQEILAKDKCPPAKGSSLLDVRLDDSGLDEIPKDSYYSREFMQKELEHVWSRVWQPVCHEMLIREPGELFVYDHAAFSVLVTRLEDGALKAYFNSCPHRGAPFRNTTGVAGKAKEFKCPFHGFSWNLDGSLDNMACAWDFDADKRDGFTMAELQVDTWGGFVFVNPDPNAESLHSYFGQVIDDFKPWDEAQKNRVPVIHVRQTLGANWKLCTEAFLETLHVVGIHRQALPRIGNVNTQYDIIPPHATRMIAPVNVVSTLLDTEQSEQEIVDQTMALHFHGAIDGKHEDDPTAVLSPEVIAYLDPELRENPFTVPEGWTARSVLAALTRAQLMVARGDEFKDKYVSDAECGDSIHYTIFPGFNTHGGYTFGNTFWFRPVDDDPEKCVMEFYILREGKAGEKASAPKPKAIILGETDSMHDALPEIGQLAAIFDQDVRFVRRHQQGIRNGGNKNNYLLNYTESRIRNFRHTLDRYIEGKEDRK